MKREKRRFEGRKKEREGDMEWERALTGLRSRTEWKERWQRGYGERERWVEGGRREICVLFHYSLWSGDILGGSQRDGRAFLFFLFFSWILFFLVVSPNQLLHFSLSASPSHLLSLLFLSLACFCPEMEIWDYPHSPFLPWWKRNNGTDCALKFMYEMRNNVYYVSLKKESSYIDSVIVIYSLRFLQTKKCKFRPMWE